MTKKRYSWPENFTVGVLKAPGLDTANVVKQWTSVLAKDTGINAHLAYTTDKSIKFKWVRYGIADIADGGAFEFGQMLEGDRLCGNRDTGAFPVRMAWVLSKYDSGFMVRGDSPIKDIYDIKPGVRVVDMRSFLPSQANVEGLLAWAGIYDLEKDVRWVPAHNTEEKAQLIVDGKADIAFAVPTASSTFKAEENPHGIRWIELNSEKDPEGAKRFHEKCLLIDHSPMFRGVQSCRGRWGMVGIDQFCCSANADVDLIYNLAKWLDENWTRYKDLHPWLTQTTLNNVMTRLDTTFIPCHEGLIRYLKELGRWTDAHQKRQKQNVDLIDRYCAASQKAMWLADEKGIVVAVDNPEWVELWKSFKKEQNLPLIQFLPSLGKGQLA
ncbi:MAG: hypothetical protein C4555_00990 [Dehalococcoidia bacterium]|jgi:hypothetical protein|nr:MAG: hypothetical protein C4555_00990 [Dehalococcoidia bacterium]